MMLSRRAILGGLAVGIGGGALGCSPAAPASAPTDSDTAPLTTEASLLDFRTKSDGDDTPAFGRAKAALAAAGGGTLRLPGGRGLGQAGAYRVSGADGLRLDVSHLHIRGDGERTTMIEAIGSAPTLTVAPIRLTAVNLSDLTVTGRGNGGTLFFNGAFDLADMVFERVGFVGSGNPGQNCIRIVHDNGGRSSGLTWTDCTFRDSARMAVEIQNHADDMRPGEHIPRYARYRFMRPRILRHASMGLSFSGYGEEVTVEGARFEDVGGAMVEAIGCSRLAVRDTTVALAGLRGAEPLIRCGNHRPMREIVIDGLRLTGTGQLATTRPLARIDNVDGFRLLRLIGDFLSNGRNDHKIIELGVNFPCRKGEISGCDLTSDGVYVISNEGCRDLAVHDNRLSSTAAGEVEFVREANLTGSARSSLRDNSYRAPNARRMTPLRTV